MDAFDIYASGDYLCITVAKGYDPDINQSINHHPNWWVHVYISEDNGYSIDVQIGNHNAVLLDATQDNGQGPEHASLEVRAKGSYRVGLLTKGLGFVKDNERTILRAMEALYRHANAA